MKSGSKGLGPANSTPSGLFYGVGESTDYDKELIYRKSQELPPGHETDTRASIKFSTSLKHNQQQQQIHALSRTQ